MKKSLLSFVLLLFTLPAFSQGVAEACNSFDTFYKQKFLTGRLTKAETQRQFKQFTTQFRKALGTSGNAYSINRAGVFPLKGYKAGAIGGTRGNGYSDKGFHFLDGNKHTAHPAHDIFIKDKDQDNIDDATGKPVDVLVIDDGYVIACTNQWDTTSSYKGGRFIWVYHPATAIFSYYAHNRQIFVQPGDRVARGQKIAEVGRTGLNAYKKRSPTHLHFSTFRLVNYIPVPFNGYNQLLKAIKQ